MRNSRNIVISDSQEPLKISLLSVLGVSTIQEAQVWVYSENWICSCNNVTAHSIQKIETDHTLSPSPKYKNDIIFSKHKYNNIRNKYRFKYNLHDWC